MIENILVGLIGAAALLLAVRALAPAAWLARHAEALALRLSAAGLNGPARLLRGWAPAPGGGCGGCGGACATPPAAASAASKPSATDAAARPATPPTQVVRVLKQTPDHVLREVRLDGGRARDRASR